ncbi:MAG: hypothetical protein M3299_03495, partial [Thermoproteota archaeon]|nr:hypothetical protein [Thermoproteota archaeon]
LHGMQKRKEWTGWDLKGIFSFHSCYSYLKGYSTHIELRSWVQIPPGPLFPVVQLRYWIEIVLGNCPTKPEEKGSSDKAVYY